MFDVTNHLNIKLIKLTHFKYFKSILIGICNSCEAFPFGDIGVVHIVQAQVMSGLIINSSFLL